MNKDKQMIALAKFDGIDKIYNVEGRGWVYGTKEPGLLIEHKVPNYLTDLNQIHRLEKMLNAYQRHKYTILLRGDVASVDSMWEIATANSEWRAENLLKTINKWKEDQPFIGCNSNPSAAIPGQN